MSAHAHPWSRTILAITAGLLLVANVAGCGDGSDGSGGSPAAPSTRSSDSLRTIPEWNAADGDEPVPFEAGTYLIPSSPWSVADFTVRFPAGWTAQYGHVYASNTGEADELNFYPVVVDEIYADSCDAENETKQAVGPGVDDLVAALREQAGGAAVSEPVSTTLGGYPATRIDLEIPKRVDVARCRMAPAGLQIWYSEPAEKYFVLLDWATASVYVVDVNGERQVFLTQVNKSTSAADRAELQTVLDSIHIEGSSSTATGDNTDAAPQWSGPVRVDAALPVISRRTARGWTDPRDAAFDGIDLRRVSGRGREYTGVAVIDGKNIPGFSAGGWGFSLAGRPPRVETLAATQRIIEYGVVIDADGDRDPDCQIGINNDARQHGRFLVFRVWITNLRTGTTVEQVGAPYGGLVEFGHPSEPGGRREAGFGFLGGQGTHCPRFTPSSTFYAYSSLTERGEVTAWDFAPDRAWLPMDCSRACREVR